MAFVKPVGMALVTWTDHSFSRGEYDGDEELPTMAYLSLGWLLPMRDDGNIRLAMSLDQNSDQYSEVLSLDPRVVERVVMLGSVGEVDLAAPIRLTQTRPSPFLGSEESGGQDQAEAQS